MARLALLVLLCSALALGAAPAAQASSEAGVEVCFQAAAIDCLGGCIQVPLVDRPLPCRSILLPL